MKRVVLAASIPFLISTWSFAQASGSCASPVTVPAQSGVSLSIRSLSSELDIVGGDQDSIRISCSLSDGGEPEGIHIRAERTGNQARILISGARTNNLHIRIEVPRKTGFRLRIPAGQVKVDGVSGDKDIDLHAGEVIVSNVDAVQYHSVHASVGIGEVRAAAFGADKGGFFRSFDKVTAGGAFSLRVHIMTGSVQLN